jgi:Right handed beta helix region
MKIYFVTRFILVMCISSISMLVMAQSTRTWVSGVGDDANPCSRTAPCKTLAGAISKTATGGEINVLDPGGFGAVTITKSITIDGGGIIGSILSSATNGLVINAPDALVTIRNFSINGAGTTLGINGIKVTAVRRLLVEKCTISNFSASGIDFNSTKPGDMIINNTTIINSNVGISIASGTATLDNSHISGCDTGVESKTGATTHLTGNIINNNATALKGPGKITSSKNNSVTGNGAQGVTPTVVNQQ